MGEGDGEEGEGEGEEREGEGGFSEGDEDGEMEEEGEQLQLEVVSDSITQTADSPVWQMNVLPASTSNTNSATPLTVYILYKHTIFALHQGHISLGHTMSYNVYTNAHACTQV